MAVLIVGANGATGRLLIKQLLERRLEVRIVVRSSQGLSKSLLSDENLTVTEAELLKMTDNQMTEQITGCTAVISCLGHNLSMRGVYGDPRRLVTQATQKLCKAISSTKPEKPIKFVLMNSTGNQNLRENETITLAHQFVLALIRFMLPPHRDNEEATKFLDANFWTNQKIIEWIAVRPDSLIDECLVTNYSLFSSPIRSAIFNAGKTSRINVAHFMAELIMNDDLWLRWKFKMPVIYN
jgi:putative NADH-flavin reductase